jgi:hypothetical protein
MPRGVYERKTTAKGKYNLSVKINSEVFNCVTDDIKAALDALKESVGTIKTRTIIRVENKFGVVERILDVRKAKLLFRNELSRTIFARNALAGLKSK